MEIKDTTIELKNLRFYAYHGALPHERRVGNQFLVTLSVTFDASDVMQSDDLTQGINYADLHDAIRTEMRIPSQLLEHVAHRILTRIGTDFTTVKTATITITKSTPPIPAFQGEGVSFSATAVY